MSSRRIDSEVKRYASRARYNLTDLVQILNSNFICSVGFSMDEITYIDPMIYVNDGENLFLHCSPESRIYKVLNSDKIITISVLNIRGVVLHSKISNNSINYESAIIYGRGHEIKEMEEKIRIFRLLTDRIISGRWDDAEIPSSEELSRVAVFRIGIVDFSLKVRDGFGMEITHNSIWEGVIPIELRYGEPIPAKESSLPEYIKNKLV